MKILVIDNYDSFVYNLVHYLEEFDCEVHVIRNDKFDIELPEQYDKIVLSPGPGIPDEAGLLKEVIKMYAGKKPILGVCLGQQAIGEVFGGTLSNLSEVFHGVSTQATQLVIDEALFNDIDTTFEIGRYHSWVISQEGFPPALEITSIDENGQIMSIRHREFDIRGVQFHPESVLTPQGKLMIKNWVKL
ncbi:aminodeoxychorismate/anthranilate synthase component II [Patiriisocius marinistellae]|uniref:Aminodeoxychorismate/anthranilate synthase component II n=1 Tax=Patiriisocius marinistellae TaxID=2494560 RepID=A0A5J4FX03_9FLAO|nr:aminodeoxychorismate/anthranilate synthase component II [Patiriisocius marinistellae]GEQ87277.1 aminodeoxychorismate/anthranilate synthase component II [Patiriisocius marinistellae]